MGGMSNATPEQRDELGAMLGALRSDEIDHRVLLTDQEWADRLLALLRDSGRVLLTRDEAALALSWRDPGRDADGCWDEDSSLIEKLTP